MNHLSKVMIGVAGGVAVLTGIGWAGLQVSPPNLPPIDAPQDLGTVEVPTDLPAPVRRYFQMMNPAFPDAQPWDILMFIIAAVVVVWLNRRKMFQHGEGITDVLMPEESGVCCDGRGQFFYSGRGEHRRETLRYVR